MKEYLKNLLKDTDGDPSSKRLLAFAGFIVAAVIAFTSRDVALAATFLGFAAGAIGITAWREK